MPLSSARNPPAGPQAAHMHAAALLALWREELDPRHLDAFCMFLSDSAEQARRVRRWLQAPGRARGAALCRVRTKIRLK